MYKHRSAAFVLVMFMSLLLVATPTANAPQPRNPRFVIAGWDYPDEYGQGVEGIELYENSTGSWLLYETYFYSDDTNIDWNISVEIKLRVYTWFNSTLTGAGSSNEGKLYQQHNVVVTDAASTTIFSKQNFTFVASDTGIDPPMWFYTYDVELDFTPEAIETYTVSVEYEVYYSDTEPEHTIATVTADSDDTNWEDSTNENARTSDYVAGFIMLREYWFRISIPLSQSTIITTATANFYATIIDTGSEAITLQRSTEIDLGSMEADATKPATTTTNQAAGNWPVGTGWFSIDCTDLIQALLDAGSWANNSYAGLRLYDSGGSDDGNALEDYQHADSHHTYLNITIGGEQWNTVSDLNMIFIMPIMSQMQQWTYDTLLIILGLVMIPVSTIYLAYGAKHDRSSNRLFYGLILFFMGCGLFIGGILP